MKQPKQINVGIVGTGWCGGIRAVTCASNPLVGDLHVAEIRPERLAEVEAQVSPASATTDYRRIVDDPDVDAIIVSATPESTHYPMTRECLESGKHVFLEKPIALTLTEADELVALADARGLKFTIGYSQRFNPKYAYVQKSLRDGSLGTPVSALVSRHISRKLGDKIGGRIKLSPAAMEATHDIDFLLWCLLPAQPVKVYSQVVNKVMRPTHGVEDCQWIMITLDDGVVITIGAGWIMPPAYPNFSSTWIEVVGSEGALLIDDTHKDVIRTRMSGGIDFPMSTMPGEKVDHVYAGPMEAETNHFIEAVALDRPVLVTPEQARKAMEVYVAADLSAERGEPISLPLNYDPLTEASAAD